MSSKKLIIIPTLNEGENIGPVVKKLMGLIENSDVLVLDGYSLDNTVSEALAHGAKVINTRLGLLTKKSIHSEQYLSLPRHQSGPNKTATESLKSFIYLNKLYNYEM